MKMIPWKKCCVARKPRFKSVQYNDNIQIYVPHLSCKKHKSELLNYYFRHGLKAVEIYNVHYSKNAIKYYTNYIFLIIY